MLLDIDWGDFRSDSNYPLEAGCFLLSSPFMDDFHFRRSVILMVEINQLGAIGFIINKVFEFTLEDITEEFIGFDFPVFYGGPVQLDTLHIIHRINEPVIQGSIKVGSNLFWGGSLDSIKDYLRNDLISSADIRFLVGYSGWGINQLNQEINHNSWIVTKANDKLIFDSSVEDMWQATLRAMCLDRHLFISNCPENPALN